MNGDLIAVIIGAAALALYICSDLYTRKIRELGRDELLRGSSEGGQDGH